MLNKLVKIIEVGIIVGLHSISLANKEPEFVEDEGGNLIGIKLHLPEEIIRDCEDKHWQFTNLQKKSVLEKNFSTEEKFHKWCSEQEYLKNHDCISCRIYALMFKIVNKENYLIPGDFCKRVKLGNILIYIHRRGAIDWNCIDNNNPAEIYLDTLDTVIESYSMCSESF